MPVIQGWRILPEVLVNHLSNAAVDEVDQCSSGQQPIKKNYKHAALYYWNKE